MSEILTGKVIDADTFFYLYYNFTLKSNAETVWYFLEVIHRQNEIAH